MHAECLPLLHAEYPPHCMQVLRDVQAMAPERIEALRKVVLAVRPMFLWHTDDNRKSAVDYVIHDLCSWEPTSS